MKRFFLILGYIVLNKCNELKYIRPNFNDKFYGSIHTLDTPPDKQNTSEIVVTHPTYDQKALSSSLG